MNSEVKHECWFIENPVSRELTKRITLKLGPNAQQKFIVVIRGPVQKPMQNMLSLVNIGLLTYQDEQFGVDESFEDFLKFTYDNSMKLFLQDRKQLAEKQKISVLLAGKLLPPRMSCIKAVMPFKNAEINVIRIAIKSGPVQKFKIPFKGIEKNYPEMDIDFTFEPTSAVVSNKGFKQSSTASPVEFTIQPSLIKVSNQMHSFVTITAMLNCLYKHESKTKQPETYNHLLVGRIKDTSIMFSYIV